MNAPEIKSRGVVHFIGVGGIGMSGIAEVMHNLGYRVQGSDVSSNRNIERLAGLGIKIFTGHAEEHIHAAKTVVFSSAISDDNAELRAARLRHIPVLRRADMLAELMRFKKSIAVAGTHGKTTATSLIAAILDRAGYDPTVINGGVINAYGANARMGESEWMVVEADESDGSFVRLPATIAVVTNIDREHMDHYGDFENLREAFCAFVEHVPFDSFAVVCTDHEEAAALMELGSRRVISYGLSPEAMVSAAVVQEGDGTMMTIRQSDEVGDSIGTFRAKFSLPGRHNAQNALAAVAVALELGIEEKVICEALENFSGVARRFSLVSDKGGIAIYNDYAHHPTEIKAVLQTARGLTQGKVIAIVQPHRYSRLRDLFDDFAACFEDADIIAVAPVHAAGESEIAGINRDTLIQALVRRGHQQVIAIDDAGDIASLIERHAQMGDIVVGMGAGSIGAWMQLLAMREVL